jgi:hypothetical protein
MNQGLSGLHQAHDLLVNLFFKHLNFAFVLLNEFELFHGIDSLINVLSQFFKWTFEQPFNQERNILKSKYFI